MTPLRLPDVLLIEPRVHADARGHFFELWRDVHYPLAGAEHGFVQDNVSVSQRHVLRGLHYQWPQVQGKLVSVLHGSVFDVAVDVRRDSSTFGQWVGAELSAENHRQLWVPPGFAHGFAVLSDQATFHYKVTAPYTPRDEVTVRWDDPALEIDWRVASPVVAPRDAAAQPLHAIAAERLPHGLPESRVLAANAGIPV